MDSKHTIYASFIGYITQAIVNNLAPLLFSIFMMQYGLEMKQIAFLVSMNFIVQLTVDILATKFVDRIGYRFCVVLAHITSFLGLVGLSLFSTYSGILLAVFLYAIGGGLIEVLISPIVEACPTQNKASIMSLLHSFYCWGSVLVIAFSSLFFYVFGKNHWQVLPCLWAIIPLCNAFYFSRVPLYEIVPEEQSLSIQQLFSQHTFVLLLFMMVMAGASEHAMCQWASTFAELSLGITKSLGDLLGPCLFAVLMGSSRVFYAKFGEKIDLTKFISYSCVLGVFAYLLASIKNQAVLNLFACGLCGLSVGILWPGIFSVASATFKNGGTAMFALLALGGDLGCAMGPYIVGNISSNLQTGLGFGLVFPLVLLVLMRMYKKSVD